MGVSTAEEDRLLRRFAVASRRYLPSPVKVLFVAEAPPAFHENRFFYFADVANGDALFLEMMKVLYSEHVGFIGRSFVAGYSAKRIRLGKGELLSRFCADGNFLIDALAKPMPDEASASTKATLMRNALPQLRGTLEQLLSRRETPIILIGGVTYEVCARPLRSDGWNVVNEAMINHPAHGGQMEFRSKLGAVLRSLKTGFVNSAYSTTSVALVRYDHLSGSRREGIEAAPIGARKAR